MDIHSTPYTSTSRGRQISAIIHTCRSADIRRYITHLYPWMFLYIDTYPEDSNLMMFMGDQLIHAKSNLPTWALASEPDLEKKDLAWRGGGRRGVCRSMFN